MKQVQNMVVDNDERAKWEAIREEEINRKLEILQNNANMEGNDDPMYLEQQKEMLLNELDDRGHFLPADLNKCILFTRTQLLQLINRIQELQQEQISLKKAHLQNKRDSLQARKEIKENEKIREQREREYNEK